MSTLSKILVFEEGIRYKPYLCPAGHWTIGVGWNLEAHGLPGWACHEFFTGGNRITHQTALRLLDESIEPARYEAMYWYKVGKLAPQDPIGMTDARRRACENMAFQLGYTRLAGFKNTRRYIQDGDWEMAAVECLDSKWARDDSPERAKRVSQVFRTGDDAFYDAVF